MCQCCVLFHLFQHNNHWNAHRVVPICRLDCSSLSPGQLLCAGVSPTATCGFRIFTTSGSDTCLSIRTAFGTNGAPIPFSLFAALNNGAFTVFTPMTSS